MKALFGKGKKQDCGDLGFACYSWPAFGPRHVIRGKPQRSRKPQQASVGPTGGQTFPRHTKIDIPAVAKLSASPAEQATFDQINAAGSPDQ